MARTVRFDEVDSTDEIAAELTIVHEMIENLGQTQEVKTYNKKVDAHNKKVEAFNDNL